ncbi:MAG: hypothetical protein KQH83_04860, partial [Actinobacteria bacterium]|nr:hypothetical protein [Actinomycetota bacterium]
TTTAPWPALPEVATGWEVRPGDVLLAGLDGITIVRDGETVAQPVTVPVQTAVGDGNGGIVALPTETPERIDPFGRGATVLWRLHGNGTAEAVCEAPGGIKLFEPFTDAASTTWLLFAEEREVEDWMIDHLVAMPLRLGGPVTLVEGTSWEGGFSGAVWMEGAVVFVFEAEGVEWIGATGLDGGEVELGHNPAPLLFQGYCRAGGCPGWSVHLLATVPYGYQIATVAHPDGAIIGPETSLMLFDLGTGEETSLAPLPEESALVYTRLSADAERILISRAGPSDGDDIGHASLPVLEYDLTSGALTETGMVGTAVIVRR